MLDKAIFIATKAHKGQTDKAGQPYILHPLRVMLSGTNETERICSILHDVIEDTNITLEYLKNEGFSEEILSALDVLTKRLDEDYDDYIGRIINNRIACHVKLADLCDNMDISRISNPTEKDYKRVEKYGKAAERIINVLKEEGDEAYISKREIEINGCVIVPNGCSEDQFYNNFINFIERNHWSFGGGIRMLEEDVQ